MFTGIIEETGVVRIIKKSAKSAALVIEAGKIFEDLKIGDSVATNGVCLTVTNIAGSCFSADVMNETLSRSSLGALVAGSAVNLERAMKMTERFGGHLVSGHIDGTGRITAIRKEEIAVRYTVRAAPEILRYIIEKGSIAIDGISLTVTRTGGGWFEVSVIPHTAQNTILSGKKIGSTVNLENDMIAKYVEKLMPASAGFTHEFLAQNGF